MTGDPEHGEALAMQTPPDEVRVLVTALFLGLAVLSVNLSTAVANAAGVLQ